MLGEGVVVRCAMMLPIAAIAKSWVLVRATLFSTLVTLVAQRNCEQEKLLRKLQDLYRALNVAFVWPNHVWLENHSNVDLR